MSNGKKLPRKYVSRGNFQITSFTFLSTRTIENNNLKDTSQENTKVFSLEFSLILGTSNRELNLDVSLKNLIQNLRSKFNSLLEVPRIYTTKIVSKYLLFWSFDKIFKLQRKHIKI
jgi:hypothetical protein